MVLIVISIGSFFVRGLNLAVDFTGGVQVQASFSNAVNIDALRTGLEARRLPRGAGAVPRILAPGGDPPAAADRPERRCDPRAASRACCTRSIRAPR